MGCHDAIKELNRHIERGKTNFVVDADIKGFFNNMTHERIVELIKFRISDPNILWLVKKLLTAGVVEDGKWNPTTKGSKWFSRNNVLANVGW